MDKKTKDALITIVRHVLDSDKNTEDPVETLAKQYDEKIAMMRRENEEKLAACWKERDCLKKELLEEIEKITEENAENWQRVEILEVENGELLEKNKKLQEQADIDKMQIALYDKENKELRRKFSVIKDIVRKACNESLAGLDVPEETVFETEQSNGPVKCFFEYADPSMYMGVIGEENEH